MDNFASRYVPELDGLRGIAIVTVLIHHQLTPFLLPGGFLGVDLFFVLSGFLITGLLVAEFDTNNFISLKNFYMRRVLRLGPALTLYLLACFVVAYHTNAIEIVRQIKLIGLAIVYATNWRIAYGWDTALDPTAIVWSLSIEEQFYLVWPLIFFGFLLLRVKRCYIAGALVLAILLILAHRYRLFTGGADLTRLYYGTDTRADALLIGCFTALIPVREVSQKTKRSLGVFGLISAACLMCAMMTVGFSDRVLYLGGFTAIGLLCAAVVLVSTYYPSKLLSATLQWRPLRWLGRISYGLYLWHWLVVRNTSFYQLGKWEPWARLTLALLIASASYYLVERNFNKLKRRFAPKPVESMPTASRSAPEGIPRLPLPVGN